MELLEWSRVVRKLIVQVRLRMSQHVSLLRGQGTRPVKVPDRQQNKARVMNFAKVPDRQNEALWCHLMLGARAWQEVLREREEEGEQVANWVFSLYSLVICSRWQLCVLSVLL